MPTTSDCADDGGTVTVDVIWDVASSKTDELGSALGRVVVISVGTASVPTVGCREAEADVMELCDAAVDDAA